MRASAGASELFAQAARLFQAGLPVIAAVQGAAVGGRLGLACAADSRGVASPAARFCANLATLGLHHGFGLSVTLPAIIGGQYARDLLYPGRRVDGEGAVKLDLADRLVDPAELLEAARELVAQIAAAAPLAVRPIRGGAAGCAGRAPRREEERPALGRSQPEIPGPWITAPGRPR